MMEREGNGNKLMVRAVGSKVRGEKQGKGTGTKEKASKGENKYTWPAVEYKMKERYVDNTIENFDRHKNEEGSRRE